MLGSKTTESFEAFIERLIRGHGLYCRDSHCPFTNPDREIMLAETFEAECAGTGGWSHRNLNNPIGWAGEYLVHLAIPEICLHGGTGLLTTPMDGTTPRGEAEIRAATACLHTNGTSRWAFTIRSSQRRDHALPLICVGLSSRFLEEFAGRQLALPTCAAQVAELIDAVFLIPLSAYVSPAQTFIIPHSPSREPMIRALQLLFRFSYRHLHSLGLEGLCRIRAIFDRPEKVTRALSLITVLGDALSLVELEAYQRDPHRLLSDAEAFERRVPLNARVEEALALDTIRRSRSRRERDRLQAMRETERLERERRERDDRAARREVAFALLGLLTLAADRPISALEMRHIYGLRRDTNFPPGFNRDARERGIAVCVEGERRRIRSAAGVRERRITQAERREMRARAPEWVRLIHAHAYHSFTHSVIECWHRRADRDPVAKEALALIGDITEPSQPRQLRLFS